jgi:hypothetical protein
MRLYTRWGAVPSADARLSSAGEGISVLELQAPEFVRERVDRAGYAQWTVQIRIEE